MTDDTQPIVVGGAAIKRYRELLRVVADEYVIRTGDHGLRTQVVNPSNVMMVEVELDPEVVGSLPENHSLPDRIGTPDKVLGRAIDPARKGNGNGGGDAVEIDFREPSKRVTVTIDADRGDYSITHTTKFRGIDPKSVRQEPEVPDLDLPVTARMPREAYVEAVNGILAESGGADHLAVTKDGEDFVLSAETDSDDTEVVVEGAVNRGVGDHAHTLVSSGFIRDITKAIKKTKPEKVTVVAGEEFPINIGVEFPEYGVEATYMVAPRISR